MLHKKDTKSMDQIKNTKKVLAALLAVLPRSEVAELLGVNKQTLSRWSMPRSQGGTNASGRYLVPFEKALVHAARRLEEEGWVVEDYPQPLKEKMQLGRTPGRPPIQSHRVKGFLRRRLTGKRVASKKILKEAREETGASYQTIQKVARSLRVVRTHEGFGPSSVWYWELPVDADDDEE
jgi:hypothetical protein